jgi:hypothetical protein
LYGKKKKKLQKNEDKIKEELKKLKKISIVLFL